MLFKQREAFRRHATKAIAGEIFDQNIKIKVHCSPGKRKKSSRKPQGKKKNDPLPTIFTCLFCNHEKSVTVEMNKKSGVGELECKVCGQRFQCGINYLSAPVDVYSEWIDAADAVAKENNVGSGSGSASTYRVGSKQSAAGRYDDDEDDRRYEGDGIVPDDDDD
ncbi:Elf1-domain-containing protein [Hypoxylon trugodes]|uniref:Elf1-domain-containing protein n=1 Tax=Hypoxylon trugodes TaxID=326681 RepID=UPI0021A10A6E|nr:Elf1-domain-containing protein [Hypoxylon trugodes]KAI1391143.1 Elf1-domain-containing protein [Hypoxylon trugodes]